MLLLTQTERPFSFDAMIGHTRIINEMKRRSKDLSFPSVMMFEGETGTGKTTLALIVASIINDPDPILDKNGVRSPNPESPICKTVLKETFSQSIILKDASKMGKDEVAALEKTVSEKSMFSNQKKVIIIDEAQELSKAGKGVVLKLLEKKREDVFFILCTMEATKFEKAVRDRMACYKFKPIATDDLAKYLFETLKEMPEYEKVPDEFISEGLFTIADGAQGSVRGAVQMFDRCLKGEIYTKEDIIDELGIVTNEIIAKVVDTLLIKKDPKGIALLDGVEFEQFYFMSRKALMNAFIYKETGHIDKKYKWQKTMFEAMKNVDHAAVLDLYLQSLVGGFKPNEDVFKIKLLSYVTNPPVVSVTSVWDETKLQDEPSYTMTHTNDVEPEVEVKTGGTRVRSGSRTRSGK